MSHWRSARAFPTFEHIDLGCQLLATIEGGTRKYHYADHLSVRLMTDGTVGSPTYGQTVGQRGLYPFGDSLVWYETGTTDKWKFTVHERDGESLNDYAIARSYINRFGRFASPDPVAGSVADPQSLNRYAYVRNDPISFVDPLGMRMRLTDEPVKGGLYEELWLGGIVVVVSWAQLNLLTSLTQTLPAGSVDVNISWGYSHSTLYPASYDPLHLFWYDLGEFTVSISGSGSSVGIDLGQPTPQPPPPEPPVAPCRIGGGRSFGPGHRAADFQAPGGPLPGGYGRVIVAPEDGTVVRAEGGHPHVPEPPGGYDLSQPARIRG